MISIFEGYSETSFHGIIYKIFYLHGNIYKILYPISLERQ